MLSMIATPTSDHSNAVDAVQDAIDKHRNAPIRARLEARGMGRYRGYAELLEAIMRLSSHNGRGARMSLYGRSVRGEPLIALHFGEPEPSRHCRTTVVVAGLHPIEWIGIETALAAFERLVEADLGGRALIGIPISNPDGLLRVEQNLRANRRRFVRHNARGVDLNRNFDARWGKKNPLVRLVPWVYKPGSHAASEPEVECLANLLGDRRIDRALSLHSFGGAVLYPSTHTLRPVPDAEEHRGWARRIGNHASDRGYRAVQASLFSMGMTMGGLELDWFHQRHGALSLLVECSRGGFGLSRERLLDPFAWFNPPKVDEVSSRIADAILPFVRGD